MSIKPGRILLFFLTVSMPLAFTPDRASDNMVLVRGGSFQMGDDHAYSDEEPVHSVTLDSFFIGRYEVTQQEWTAVMGSNPSHYKGDNLPAQDIDWHMAIDYCNKKSKMDGLTPCYSGSGGNDPGEVAWYADNSTFKNETVGLKKANELGIYDMSGNLWEWCWDWFDKDYYKKSPGQNPRGPAADLRRVMRGGSIFNPENYVRTTFRARQKPNIGSTRLGPRVVRIAIGT